MTTKPRIPTAVVRMMRDKARAMLTDLKVGESMSGYGLCTTFATHIKRNGARSRHVPMQYALMVSLANHVASWPVCFATTDKCAYAEDDYTQRRIFTQARFDTCLLLAGSSYRKLSKLTNMTFTGRETDPLN